MLLDALLAATERLIITYTGNDERTNLRRVRRRCRSASCSTSSSERWAASTAGLAMRS